MSLDPTQIDVIVFDLDNTLCPFGAVQNAAVCGALHQNLVRLFGPIDPHHVEVLAHKAKQAPYKGAAHSLKEHDYETLLTSYVTTLYGHAPDVVRLEQLRFALEILQPLLRVLRAALVLLLLADQFRQSLLFLAQPFLALLPLGQQR